MIRDEDYKEEGDVLYQSSNKWGGNESSRRRRISIIKRKEKGPMREWENETRQDGGSRRRLASIERSKGSKQRK